MAYIIAVSNEKGGVAKTTTTLSLGAALAGFQHKVLLVDMDPQANLTLGLSIDEQINATASEILLENYPLESAIVKTNISGIHLLAGSGKMSQAEQFLPLRMNYLSILRNALRPATYFPYDFVLIDCPPSLGAITANALTAANLLIIPTQAEYFSAYALRDMMATIRHIRANSNAELAYRILITMLDRRNRAHRLIREQLNQTFGVGLFDTIIEVDTKLRESPIAGQPITEYKPTSRSSLQYRVLAEELIQYVEKTNTQPA